MMSEDVVESCESGSKRCRVQSKEYDAGVRVFVAKDKFTEIRIVGDKDASLTPRQCKNLWVGQPWLIIAGDRSRIVSETMEVSHNTTV